MKIFRKFRQRFLIENNFIKYIFYAIGEIVLVVIGILIALSLNNWNESNNRKKLEKNLYNDLIEELQIDLREIVGNRLYNQKYLARYNQASQIILSDKEMKLVDTLGIIATELTNFSDFRNEGTAYQKLMVSGKIDLVSNDNILNSLQNLGILYIYINRLEKNQEQYMYTIVPKLTKYLRMRPMQIMRADKLYEYEFQNDIEIMIKIGYEKEGLYEQAENDLNNLISLLKKNVN